MVDVSNRYIGLVKVESYRSLRRDQDLLLAILRLYLCMLERYQKDLVPNSVECSSRHGRRDNTFKIPTTIVRYV